MSDVTHILSEIEFGDPSAAEQLLPVVYDELRKFAAARLAQEKPEQTLQARAHREGPRQVVACHRAVRARLDCAASRLDVAARR